MTHNATYLSTSGFILFLNVVYSTNGRSVGRRSFDGLLGSGDALISGGGDRSGFV